MKYNLNIHSLPVLSAVLGAAALLLRFGTHLWSIDEKGLLIPMHPVNLLLWAVTAAAFLIIVLSVRKRQGSNRYADNFSPSTGAALGALALAAGIALSFLSGWTAYLRLDQLRNLTALLAVPALVCTGLYRRQGKQPFFAFHGIICLFLTLYAVSHYQAWSSQPQLENYFFCMMGSVFLCLFAYHQTAFDVGMGNRRMHLFTGLTAGFFCITAVIGSGDPLLYLGGALWTLTNLCSLTPVRRRRPDIAPQPQDNAHESA